ncbi:MAG: hypothetical protein Q9225_007939, partial [Loekoesia sp. 1 TL-2023]
MEVYQAGSMECLEGVSSLAQSMANGLALDIGITLGRGMGMDTDIGEAMEEAIALDTGMDMVKAMDDGIATAKVKQSLK